MVSAVQTVSPLSSVSDFIKEQTLTMCSLLMVQLQASQLANGQDAMVEY